MPNATILVEHQAAGSSTWTTISNVQTLNISQGRTKLTDNFRPGTATITGRRPDLLPTIKLADTIRVTVTATASFQYKYRVSNTTTTHGTVSAMDAWEIDCEDGLAQLGRGKVTISAGTSTTAGRLLTICLQLGMPAPIALTSNWNATAVTTPALTNAAALDVTQTLLNTEQGAIFANGDQTYVLYRGWQGTQGNVYVSDDGTGTTPGTYTNIQFGSMLDNYATKVVATSPTSQVSSGTGSIVTQVDTYAVDDAQLQNVADFVKGSLSVQAGTPTQLRVLVNSQTNATAINALAPYIGMVVKFRGTAYNTIILGYSLNADTNETRINYYLSSADFYKFLVLNDATYGTLDYNKLGF